MESRYRLSNLIFLLSRCSFFLRQIVDLEVVFQCKVAKSSFSVGEDDESEVELSPDSEVFRLLRGDMMFGGRCQSLFKRSGWQERVNNAAL